MLGPLLAVQVGMGEQILILTFVVVVIGGLGSIRGAFLAAMVVGLVDTALRPEHADAVRIGHMGALTMTLGHFLESSAPGNITRALSLVGLLQKAGEPTPPRSAMVRNTTDSAKENWSGLI